MATISSPGIGSGLDVNSIITKLMAIERQPITNLKTKATQIQAQISEYGKLQGATSALRDAALKLTSNDTWGQTTGTSSSAAVGVAVRSAAIPGDFTIEVQSLAKAQALASGVFASPAALVGAGQLHIEPGSWGPGQTSFTPKPGAGAVDVTIEAGDTLAQVRDKINASGAGVTAMVLTDGSGSRLLLRSSATGSSNAFRTTVNDADGNNADAAGLSALAFDPSSSSAVMTQTDLAADARATLNGLAITSPGNTLADVVDGVSLTLTATTTGPVGISIRQDNEALKKSLQCFVDAYNTYAKLIAGEVKYDAANKTAGPLQGDGSVVGMQRQMRALVGASSGASSVFNRISDAGLELQRDGTIKIDAGKLESALARLPELKKLFANVDLVTPANDGIARQFRLLGDTLLGAGGTLTTRTDGLRKRVDTNQKQQDALEVRVAQTETRLRAQYTALDTTLGQLSSMSNYVTQQIAAWNTSSKS